MGNKIWKASNVRKTVNYLKKAGVRCAYYAARERIAEEKRANYYYKEPAEETLAAQQKESEPLPYLFSIVVPAYETKEEFLRDMIASVRRQSYRKWELIIADASKSDVVRRIVGQIMEETGDARMKYRRLAENKGISENTNAGIALAAGDYIALLDHDDFLAPDALYHMAAALHRSLQHGVLPDMLYTDEDKYEDASGRFISPHRKEKLNLDLILSNNYVCHFMAVESKVMKNLKLRGEYDGAQDYDLVLRIVGRLLKEEPGCAPEERMLHIPKILYHWRCHEDSTAQNTASKTYAYEAGKAALADFIGSQGWRATVGHSLHWGFYDITYEPDMLSVREDVGIVGGRIINHRGRICAGMYNEKGETVFLGLPKEYTGGSTHRASLAQDCAAVDIRCIRLRNELHSLFKEVTGVSYCERELKNVGKGGKIRIADVSRLHCDEAGYRKLSMELCRGAAAKGYRIVWNPRITIQN